MNKDSIVKLLRTNDKAVARALVVLTARQTEDEQHQEDTKYRNGRGFRPCHARMGTSMAKFYEARGYLTAKQVAYWRKTDRSGAMRIGIYAGQLLEEAEAKAAAKAAAETCQQETVAVANAMILDKPVPVEPKMPEGRCPGNDSEELMVLFEHVSGLKLQSMRERDAEKRDALLAQIARAEARVAEIKSFYK